MAALEGRTGELVWEWKAPVGSCYVSLLLDGGMLIVSVNGYMYGLDAATGNERWYNEMKGFGAGVAALVSMQGMSSNPLAAAAADEAEWGDAGGEHITQFEAGAP